LRNPVLGDRQANTTEPPVDRTIYHALEQRHIPPRNDQPKASRRGGICIPHGWIRTSAGM